MNSNYETFLEAIVNVHKSLIGEHSDAVAHEFYKLAVEYAAEKQVESEFLYLKAIDLWCRSMNMNWPANFNSIKEFADELAAKYLATRTDVVVSIDRARKSVAA